MIYTRRYQGRHSKGTEPFPAGGLRRVDPVLVAAVAGLSLLGTLLVWSATGNGSEGGRDGAGSVYRHLAHLGLGAAVCTAVAAVDYRRQRVYAPVVYAATVAGLLLVLTPLGMVVNGSQGWLSFAGIQMQPGEFAKVGLVLCVAMLLGEPCDGEDAPAGQDVAAALVVLLVPALLVAVQPDLGTALVLCAIFAGTLMLSGAPLWWSAVMGAGGIAAAAAVWWFDLLAPHQWGRVATLMDPAADPQGAGYNAHQALIAIGSGGVHGTGLFQGGQTAGHFVPEQHTDFIFTVAGEELGLFGGLTVLGLFGLVLWRILGIAASCSSPYARLVCAGVASWLGFQGFVNIGMALGVAPITGLPLPFMSYGGSAAVANFAGVGLVLGVHARDHRFG